MKRGITLAVLSIVILVTVILATAATTTGTMALNESKKIKFASEIALVQELVNEYVNKNGSYPTGTTYDVDLTDVTSNSIAQFDNEPKIDNVISLEGIDFSLLPKTDLIYGNKKDASDIYVVSYTTGKVYYLKGVKLSKITYYSLTDDLKELIGYTESINNNNNNTKDGIVFEQSITEWTNQDIDATLKVPNSSEYTNVTVSILQNGLLTSTLNISETTEGYNVYNISGVTGNYGVQVEYDKNSNYTTQNFSVTNFDNVSPSFTVTETKDLVNNNAGVSQTYISLNIASDVSGIKLAKYEIESIAHEDAKMYFIDNGMTISNNTIVVDTDVKYVTVYVEDNAGNYTTQTIEVITKNDNYVESGILLNAEGTNNTGNGYSNSSGVWKDLSGNGNNGELIGGPVWQDNGLYFDGEDDYVSFGEINSSYITMECVFSMGEKYVGNTMHSQHFFGNFENGGGGFYLNNSRIFGQFYLGTSYYKVTSSEIVESGKIYAVTITYDGKNIKLYVNGELVEKSEEIIAVIEDPQNNIPMTLGTNLSNITHDYVKEEGFEGIIYNARIYNRALTEEEVLQNYKIDKLRYGL